MSLNRDCTVCQSHLDYGPSFRSYSLIVFPFCDIVFTFGPKLFWFFLKFLLFIQKFLFVLIWGLFRVILIFLPGLPPWDLGVNFIKKCSLLVPCCFVFV